MHFEPHATLGWVIGNVGGADRRLRNFCVAGAILPDIDSIPYVFGAEYYGQLHHTFGHNIFLWGLFVLWVTVQCRSQRAFWLSLLSFGSHLFTDAWLSGWDLYLFWPFSKAGYLFPGAVGLEAPINTQLVYASFVVIALVALVYQRTPIDIFSPTLDPIVIALFRRKRFACGFCGKMGNQTCSRCGTAVCSRHGTLKRDLRIYCPDCKVKRRDSG